MSGIGDISASELRDAISDLLPSAAETLRMRAHGTEAGVLIPLYLHEEELTAVFTRRHADLSRHAGEISFPGGRRDTGEDLRQTALRETEEEIGLPREHVDLVGALPPVSTFVTNYSVYPFVAVIEPGFEYVLSPIEVEDVVELRLGDLISGYEKKRLMKRGVPVKTDTFTVGDDFIWGATARILGMLLQRLEPLIEKGEVEAEDDEQDEQPPRDETSSNGAAQSNGSKGEAAEDESPAVTGKPEAEAAEA